MAPSALLLELPSDMGLKVFKYPQSTASVFTEPSGLETSLPPGFPGTLHNTLAWTGKDFINQHAYTYELQAKEILELETALRSFKGSSSFLLRPLN